MAGNTELLKGSHSDVRKLLCKTITEVLSYWRRKRILFQNHGRLLSNVREKTQMLLEEISRKEWEKYEKSIALFEKSPRRYYMKLAWLFVHSCLMFLFVLGILLYLFWARQWIVLLVFLGVSALGYIASMLNRPWKGLLKLDRRKYAAAYRKVNWISRKVHGPKIHAIYISPEFNASVASAFTFLPVLRRNVLILGYPLLASMSQKALIGTLAHEIGHLAGNHLSVSLVFYSLESFWESLHLGVFNLITGLWLRYYLPAVHIAALPIYRRHEVEADRFIVETMGADYAAAALIQTVLAAERYGKLNIQEKLSSEEWKSFDIALFFRDYFQKPLPQDEAEKIIVPALHSMLPINDEHPPFRERLEIAGMSDWHVYFAQNPDALRKLIGDDPVFHEEVNQFFHRLYDSAAEDARTIRQEADHYLCEHKPDPEAGLEEINDIISALQTTGKVEQCNAFIESCYAAHPEIPEIACRYGMLLTDHGECSKGIAIIEEAVAKCPSLILFANDTLVIHYLSKSDSAKLKDVLELRTKQSERISKMNKLDIPAKDQLTAFRPDAATQKHLIECMKNIAVIERAYCVQKIIEDGSSGSIKFIVLEQCFGISFRYSRSLDNELLNELEEEFGYKFVVKSRSFCREYLVPVSGALFYDRKNS